MMNKLSKGNQILAAVLVVQIILAVVVLWPRGAVTAGGEGLFGELEAAQINRVSITDTEGTTIEIAREAGEWVLASGGDYPAKGDAVTDFLDKLVAMTDSRLVAEKATSHRQLKVADDDYNRLVEFSLEDGTQHAFYVGSAPSYGVAHIRVVGEDETYLISNLTLSDVSVSASTWVDTVYFSIPGDEIVGVTVENPQGTFDFSKDDAGAWTLAGFPEGETPNDSTINYVYSRVDDFRLLTPLGTTPLPEYGIDPPTATVTVQRQDAEGNANTYVFTIGAQDPDDNTWVMKSSESPFYVRVSQYTADDLVNWSMDSFIAEPTPVPTPAQ